jgi:hypothetical protein
MDHDGLSRKRTDKKKAPDEAGARKEESRYSGQPAGFNVNVAFGPSPSFAIVGSAVPLPLVDQDPHRAGHRPTLANRLRELSRRNRLAEIASEAQEDRSCGALCAVDGSRLSAGHSPTSAGTTHSSVSLRTLFTARLTA